MDYWRTLASNGTVDLAGCQINTVEGTKKVIQLRGLNGTTRNPILIRPVNPAVKLSQIRIDDSQFVILTGFTFDGDVPDKILFWKSKNIWIEGNAVSGDGTGISAQSCENVVVRRNAVGPLSANGLKSDGGARNVEGMYFGEVNGLLIESNTIANVGFPATEYNQGIYVNGACDDVVIRDNTIDMPASTGIQARSGGVITGNKVSRACIGITAALVNGEGPQKKGGCTLTVSGNAVLNNRAMSPTKRMGFGIIIGTNVLDGKVTGNLIYGDSTGAGYPLMLELGRGTFAGNQIGVHKLEISNNVVVGYANPVTYINTSLVKTTTPTDVDNEVSADGLVIKDNRGVVAVRGNALWDTGQAMLRSPIPVGATMPALDAPLKDWLVGYGLTQSAVPVPEPTPPPAAKPVQVWVVDTRTPGNKVQKLDEWPASGQDWSKYTTLLVQDVPDGAKVTFVLDGVEIGTQRTPPLYMWGDTGDVPTPGRRLDRGVHTIVVKVDGVAAMTKAISVGRPRDQIMADIKAKLGDDALLEELNAALDDQL